MKNPLRPTSFFFYIASAAYITPLLIELASGLSLQEVIEKHKVIMTFLFLSAAFIISYHRRSIFAWHIAADFYPVIFLIRAIINSRIPDVYAFLGLLIVYLFRHYYLVPLYKPYKEFIGSEVKSIIDEPSTLRELEIYRNSKPVQQNPLRLVFYATIIIVLHSLFIVFKAGVILTQTQAEMTTYTYHAVMFLMAIAFGLFYWKNSIAAWWVAMIAYPAAWAVRYLFQPFVLNIFLFSLIFEAVIIWYLVLKYNPYKNYIQNKQEETNRDEAVEKVS